MKITCYLFIFLSLLVTACQNDHFISDAAYRDKVEKQFEKQKELAKNRSSQLFDIFNLNLSVRESEALKFIYAYSSLSDLADYNGDFFLQNIRSSFAARDTFSWGKTIPENLFRHFVIPVRVNNENLDSSRWVFFAELKNRVKNMSMKQAVLEVNHWCHEKVTYRGSDGRTSSPLASVKTAWGRCGEESTLTVAALRSVSIPARQCYTPRWAHSDDNHAWVEVWVDGKWHYIGACEPDADLNLAWFTKPAKRAMLVNTTVFGDYEGPEDVLEKDALFTKINVLENYTRAKRVFARVTDASNHIVDSANVEFQLYNYAEFYPLFKTVTDKNGLCSFSTGYGDLLVWAAKNDIYGFRKLDARTSDTVTIILDRQPGQVFDLDFDLVPPVETEIITSVSDSAKAYNSKRLAFEDGIRSGYESTFMDSSKSVRFARLVNADPDSMWIILHKSYGNWRTLTSFITQVPVDKRSLIFPLFDNVSDKDLRDIDTTVLFDNLNNAERYAALSANKTDFGRYVLSPRVDNEFLRPFRQFFLSKFNSPFIDSARKNPLHIAGWMRKNIIVNNKGNYSRAPVTPIGVIELGVADGHSVDICFVAMCRSFGIPARLDPATKIPQYFGGSAWHDIFLSEQRKNAGEKGSVTLVNAESNQKKPEYTIHYTLEEFKNGYFKTLDYEGSELVSNYPCTLQIPVGPCMMVTGNRLTNGSVLAKIKVFEVRPGETATQSIALRQNQMPQPEYGKINPSLFGTKLRNGMIIAWIDPDKEPTKHLLDDLRHNKADFEKWKGVFYMLLPSQEMATGFMKKETAGLPGTITFGSRTDFPVQPDAIRLKAGNLKNLPAVIFINKSGTVNYISEGYRIGLGDELLTLMHND
jgi:hypothetical protein